MTGKITEPVRRPGWRATFSGFIVGLALLATPFTVAVADYPPHWAATWATASKTITPFDAPLPAINDTTIRQVVRISMGGSWFRVWLTNEFGTEPLNVGEARLARREAGSAVRSGTDRQLMFGGQTSVVIPPGARVVSDPVELFAGHLSDLVVSVHLPDDISMSESPVSYHVRALQTNYLADGNQTAAADLDAPTMVPSWFYLSAIDVGRDRPVDVVAALGDSITDGDQTQPEPVDQNARYTNFLAEYILRANDLHPNGYRYATVVNLGISGNQVNSDFLGESAQARLNRDVLSQTGVTHVIALGGINDIGLPVLLGAPAGASAAQLIAAHQQIAARAGVAGLTTIGLTLPPSGGSFLPGYGMGAVEEARQGLNAWMRTSGAYDIVVDIDAVLRDPDDATLMRQTLTADGLHPNAAGYREMAKAIYLALSNRPNRSR